MGVGTHYRGADTAVYSVLTWTYVQHAFQVGVFFYKFSPLFMHLAHGCHGVICLLMFVFLVLSSFFCSLSLAAHGAPIHTEMCFTNSTIFCSSNININYLFYY